MNSSKQFNILREKKDSEQNFSAVPFHKILLKKFELGETRLWRIWLNASRIETIFPNAVDHYCVTG